MHRHIHSYHAELILTMPRITQKLLNYLNCTSVFYYPNYIRKMRIPSTANWGGASSDDKLGEPTKIQNISHSK